MRTGYNARGEAFSDTNPAGTVTEVTYDDAGQPVQTVQDVGGLGITTVMTYHANGQIATLTATNADTGAQVTTYTYGSTLAASAVASNELLAQTTFPEGDLETYTYNRQQQRTKYTNGNGTVHEYDYDKLGREIADRVTATGSGTSINTSVRRIERSYEVRGMLTTATSYSAASGGSVVNDVALTYNDFGQLISDAQEHSGAVTGSTPKVQYAYADGSANAIRPTSMTYPNGTVFTWLYAGVVSSALSRVDFVTWAGSLFRQCWYFYLGLNTLVRTNYLLAGMRWDLITGSGADPYAGLDRFGRVIDCLWYKSSAPTADLARLEYGYNRASSRLWRKDAVAATNFDELYTYDAVQRLIDMQRGTLTGGPPPTSIINQKLQQDWTLDPTGNWKAFNVAELGSATLEQQRASNTNNEITAIGATLGTTWSAPIYDEAGNMFRMPDPLAPAGVRFAIYDGWGRMAQFSNGLYNLGTYAYDGLNRRIIKRSYTSGTLTETRHCYFSDQWQVLEERVGSSTDPDRQYVWGIRYVDDLILRERDTDGNGTLDERLYALQDANWNVVAICDSSAAIQERYVYEPYGAVDFRAPNFGSRGSSSFAWSYLFTGRERDVESGLQYNRNRYLHLQLGCWTQRDPIGFRSGDVNPYRYVKNAPANVTDPSGLEAWCKQCPGCIAIITSNIRTCQSRNCSVQNRPSYVNKSNGCGPGGWLGILIPDTPYGYNFSKCCDAHDKCWGTCRTSQSAVTHQQTCDIQFLKCMQQVCKAVSAGNIQQCYAVANVYFEAVSRTQSGKNNYHAAQEEACICCCYNCP